MATASAAAGMPAAAHAAASAAPLSPPTPADLRRVGAGERGSRLAHFVVPPGACIPQHISCDFLPAPCPAPWAPGDGPAALWGLLPTWPLPDGTPALVVEHGDLAAALAQALAGDIVVALEGVHRLEDRPAYLVPAGVTIMGCGSNNVRV